jgi:hypothetical protein
VTTGFYPPDISFELRDLVTVADVLERQRRRR